MATSLEQENALRYTIPSWFLENNVKTAVETAQDEPKIAVVDEPLGENDSEKRPAGFEILEDDYDAIQLTAAATLIRDDANLLPEKTPNLLLEMRTDSKLTRGGVSYFDCLVKRLARDLEAGLISVSPNDLERLGRDFNLEDQQRAHDSAGQADGHGDAAGKPSDDTDSRPPEQPDENLPYAFTQFYFGVRSERKGTAESQKRNKAAIDALLESVRMKKSTIEGPSKHNGVSDPPVLLHLEGVMFLGDSRRKYRILRRFARRIEEFRTATAGVHQGILGIASEVSADVLRVRYQEKFSSEASRTFSIPSPPNYATHASFYNQIEFEYTRARRRRKNDEIRVKNLRRFKQILEAKLAKAFEAGVLAHGEGENAQQRWLKEVFPGREICSVDNLHRAAMQVAGMQWKKTGLTLTLDDVVAVTTRMRRMGIWDGEEEPEDNEQATDTEQGENTQQEKNTEHEKDTEQDIQIQDPWDGLALKQRQDKVSELCDPYEKKLLGCIVDPEELTTTYDDVIIAEETKEQIKLLVMLSRVRPEATSRTLLQDLCVSGALFYGVPGTGKTLLCRAIANESSSNMLALRPADVTQSLVGETEKFISAAFSLAAKLSPCVLLIDEVDALFYRRSGGDKSWERTALNQFLQEMDGLTNRHKDSAPFVIVGTNRPGDLDDAFLRRLPHKVLFELPAAAERERILRVLVPDGDAEPQLDFGDLADRTQGFSGSDLRSLCGHAVLAWAAEQAKLQPNVRDVVKLRVYLQRHHFETALMETKPTVSWQSTKALREFAGKSNPEKTNVRATRRLPAPLDESHDAPKTYPIPSPAPEQYYYASLPRDSSIRILHIDVDSSHPFAPEIPGLSLEVVDLDNKPSFTALSYTWGPPCTVYESKEHFEAQGELYQTAEIPVICDGRTLWIKQNLYDFLRRCKSTVSHLGPQNQQSKAVELPNLPTKIWIDSVCINQHNDAEKNKQVAIMDKIYSSCENVLVWLGTGDSFVEPVITFLSGFFWSTDAEIEMCRRNHEAVTQWLGRKFASLEWSVAFFAFFNRSWFTRAWIVQEVALAPKVHVLCGRWHFSFDMIEEGSGLLYSSGVGEKIAERVCYGVLIDKPLAYNALTCLPQRWEKSGAELASRQGQAIDRPDDSQKKHGKLLCRDTDLHSTHPDIRIFSPTHKARKHIPGFLAVCISEVRCSTKYFANDRNSSELLRVLHLCRQLESTDPRDKFYAFRGLLTIPEMQSKERNISLPIPDYTKTPAQIYQELAWHIISLGNDLELLSHLQDRSLTRVENTDLPSWVPDWSTEMLPNSTNGRKGAKWSASGHLSQHHPKRQHKYCGDVLEVRGYFVDKVSKVSDSSPVMLDYRREFFFNFVFPAAVALSTPTEYRWHHGNTKVGATDRDGFELAFPSSDLHGTIPLSMYRKSAGVDVPRTESRVEALWRTLVMDCVDGKHPAPLKYGWAFGRFVTRAVEGYERLLDLSPDARVASMREACKSSYDALVQSEPSPWCEYDMLFAAAKTAKPGYDADFSPKGIGFIPPVQPTDESCKSECDEDLETFLSHIGSTMGMRRIFSTVNHYLGNGPFSLLTDDEVWILEGAKAPFILRPVDDNRYQVMGDAYVHGIMLGEALHYPDFQFRDIQLV